jgi:hypothetical protein
MLEHIVSLVCYDGFVAPFWVGIDMGDMDGCQLLDFISRSQKLLGRSEGP